MSDLYGWTLEHVAAREDVARAATAGPWKAESHYVRGTREVVYSEVHPVAELEGNGDGGVLSEADALHIALNGPDDVLRRCTADRRLLERHQPQQDGSAFPDSMQCRTCSQDGGDGYQYLVPAPCPTLRDLAEGYGWAGE